MDVKYHAFLSVVLAAIYVAFLGGNPAGAALILVVGIGMDIDHPFAYLYRTRDFRAGFPGVLKNCHAHYLRTMDWLYFRKGEPYAQVDLMPLHLLEVALLAGLFVESANPALVLPVALGYAGHVALDLVSWHQIVFKSRTRTAAQMAGYFLLSYRLFLGPGIAPGEANIL